MLRKIKFLLYEQVRCKPNNRYITSEVSNDDIERGSNTKVPTNTIIKNTTNDSKKQERVKFS